MRAAAFVVLAACGSSAPEEPAADAAAGGRAIVAGERIGAIALGMRWDEVVDVLGLPPADPVVLVRLGHASWPAHDLEAVLTSPDDAVLAGDAVVIAIGATAPADFTGPSRPGLDRAAIEDALGAAPETYGGRDYYPDGVAIEYGAGEVATRVGVVAPYTLAPEPPPMQPAQTRRPR